MILCHIVAVIAVAAIVAAFEIAMKSESLCSGETGRCVGCGCWDGLPLFSDQPGRGRDQSEQQPIRCVQGDFHCLRHPFTSIYVVPKRSVLLLHGDIITPVMFMPNLMGYSFLLDVNGNPGNLQEVSNNTEDVMALAGPNVTVEPGNYKLFSGAFNGDGVSDLLMQGAAGKSSIVLTAGPSGPSILRISATPWISLP